MLLSTLSQEEYTLIYLFIIGDYITLSNTEIVTMMKIIAEFGTTIGLVMF